MWHFRARGHEALSHWHCRASPRLEHHFENLKKAFVETWLINKSSGLARPSIFMQSNMLPVLPTSCRSDWGKLITMPSASHASVCTCFYLLNAFASWLATRLLGRGHVFLSNFTFSACNMPKEIDTNHSGGIASRLKSCLRVPMCSDLEPKPIRRSGGTEFVCGICWTPALCILQAFSGPLHRARLLKAQDCPGPLKEHHRKTKL